MIGAIIGDILGSVYEANAQKVYDMVKFSVLSDFTDDTVLTIAVADAFLTGKDFSTLLHTYGNKYQDRGYGGRFLEWLASENPQPYNSFGNGSAMRVSPVGYVAKSRDEAMELARKTALPTHNHPEGIKGAQAVALAIYFSRKGLSKEEIREEIENEFDYDLSRSYNWIQQNYSFDVTCQGSVPEAIISFIESTDFTSAIRMAVALGGDADTQACIAGSIAEAYYGRIAENECRMVKILPDEMLKIIERFYEKYDLPRICEI